MATVTEIAQALLDVLDGVSGVDQASIIHYLPPIKTQSIALIIPPMRQESLYGYGALDESGTPDWESHRFFAEFWVKHSGNDDDLAPRVRAILEEAPQLILADQTLGGTVSAIGWTDDGDRYDPRIRTQVDADLLALAAGVPFLRVTVEVPVCILGG